MENYCSHQQKIKLISECFVKPKYEVEAANQPYHLGPVDLVMLSIDPMQKGLLYNYSSSSNVVVSQLLLDNLKKSLSIALVYFYPLAGRFRIQKHPDQNACSVFVDCNKGPGARFIHAKALELAVSDISASNVDATIVHPLFDLGERYVNFDGLTKALVCVQVTELRDGMFIGFSMNHSVADGNSFTHFIRMLSEIFSSLHNNNENKLLNISRVPVLNYRPWLSSHNDNPILKVPVLDLEESIYRGFDPGPLRERVFHFGPTSIAQLKNKANQECKAQDYDVVISSFQALTAFVWRSLVRVRNLRLDQVTTCFLVIDVRNRLDPPISANYFGSFIGKNQWGCKVRELLRHNLGWAAKQLHDLITTRDTKITLELFNEGAGPPMLIPRGFEANLNGENSLIMGGSTRFDMYGIEFGLGRAVAVRWGFANKEDGKVTATAGCECGSVELDILLRPHIMAALEADHEFMSFVTTI